MSSFVKSHINFSSLGRSLNFGQSSPIIIIIIIIIVLLQLRPPEEAESYI
jgi:hypothetical protein